MDLRYSSGVDDTLGLLFDVTDAAWPKFMCYLLQDEHREVKVPGQTRIPAGRYRITLRTEGGFHQRYSTRFPWHRGMLWLRDVPGFEWILIHPGNDHTHTDGCLLTGDSVYSNVGRAGRLGESVKAYERIYQQIVAALEAGDEVWIQVQDYA